MTSVTEFAAISALSFLFGITQKLADGHHEHGLNLFPYAGVVFGCLWGGIGFCLISYSPVLQAVYLSLLLYWFYKQKIDCFPHVFGAWVMLFGVFLAKGYFAFPLLGVLGLLAGYLAFDTVKRGCGSARFKWFFARRVHFHLLHLVYAVAVWDIYAYSSLFFGLLGTAFANRVFAIPGASESAYKSQPVQAG